ncbi:unnamed protein product [Peronospora belbahrii]|uniref:PH domain-containing protein n=1 Tax=Peronospora belbahrii TaxID=622444 RepID=A0ABN8DCV5_9STRA|nr:unnamed protein product [Peronospora belbahrii]
MWYGKLSVQAWNLMWFPSPVCLVCVAHLKQAATCGAFNLVIRRPRIAGGTMTIALDSTVKLVNVFSKDAENHIIRLQHGSNGKLLTMRASSSQERERWLAAIAAALSTSVHSRSGSKTSSTGNAFKMFQSFRPTKPQPISHDDPTRGNSSFQRMIRQNIPGAMQLLLTVGQIITAAN